MPDRATITIRTDSQLAPSARGGVVLMLGASLFGFDWPWPMVLTLAVIVVVVFWVVRTYLRDADVTSRPAAVGLAALRLAAAAILLLTLARMTLLTTEPIVPRLAVVLDDSLSTTLPLRGEPAQPAANTWSKLVEAIGASDTVKSPPSDVAIQWLRLSELLAGREEPADETTLDLAQPPEATTSPLGDAVVRAATRTVQGEVPDAVLLLTDGVVTEGEPLPLAAETLSRRGTAMHVIIPGRIASPAPRLIDLIAPRETHVGDVVALTARIAVADTSVAGRRIDVTLLRDDGETPIDRRTISVSPNQTLLSVTLFDRPTSPGVASYTVKVVNSSAPTQPTSLMRKVTVAERKIRVLLVGDEPTFEFRFLWNLLFRDRSIDLTAVLQRAAPEVVRPAGAVEPTRQSLSPMPTSADALSSYDVIVLVDASPELLGEPVLDALAKVIDDPENGGRGLAVIAGHRHTPAEYHKTALADLLPIRTTASSPSPAEATDRPLRILPTREGERFAPLMLADLSSDDLAQANDQVWHGLTPVYWLAEPAPLVPGVRVLAACPDRLGPDGEPVAVVCLRHVGAGRVLYHGTDATWRWQRGGDDRLFARYWTQMLRHLAQRPDGTAANDESLLRAQPSTIQVGQSAILTAQLPDVVAEEATVAAETPDRRRRHMTLARSGAAPNEFVGVFDGTASGTFTVTLQSPLMTAPPEPIILTVVPPLAELLPLQPNMAPLAEAIEKAGGTLAIGPREENPIDMAVRHVAKTNEGRTKPARPTPLWNRWPLLAALLFCLVTEWIGRRLIRLP